MATSLATDEASLTQEIQNYKRDVQEIKDKLNRYDASLLGQVRIALTHPLEAAWSGPLRAVKT